jgi:hypothetical protein
MVTPEELEKRVKALEGLGEKVKLLEDIEAIKQLHQNYVYLLCNLQWDDMLECFAENAQLELPGQAVLKGKKEISGVFHNVLGKMIKRTDGHFVGQPVITVDGDRAKGYWILYLFFAEPEVKWGQGRQDCEYVRVNGKWKFSSVKFTLPWPTP